MVVVEVDMEGEEVMVEVARDLCLMSHPTLLLWVTYQPTWSREMLT